MNTRNSVAFISCCGKGTWKRSRNDGRPVLGRLRSPTATDSPRPRPHACLLALRAIHTLYEFESCSNVLQALAVAIALFKQDGI